MIVGTAGHIDHGKTALVKALTGVDADRLKEEKARGITIDLGFAYLPLETGQITGFVDVPGHERFVHTMLAGASGIDLALLVVAANEGLKPQTLEHLAILDLLGVRRGIVVLSKADLADAAQRDAVTATIRAVLAPTGLADAPVLPVSTVTREGIDALKAALRDAERDTALPSTAGLFRLSVDRCFTLAGAGTVVTGTVLSGSVTVGDRVLVSPSGISARVRSIHAQNRPAEQGVAGQRCALNLAGEAISKDAIRRGDIVLDPVLHAPTDRIDAEFRLLPSEAKPIGQWFPARLHHASVELGVRVVPLGDPVLPGQSAKVQLVLEQPIAAAVGDRFVLRDVSAKRTVGGGRFLDLRAPARKRRSPERLAQLDALTERDPAKSFEQLLGLPPFTVDLAGFGRDHALGTEEAERLIADTSATVIEAEATRLALSKATWQAFQQAVEAQTERFHAEYAEQQGIGRERLRMQTQPRLPPKAFGAALQSLARSGEIVLEGSFVRLPGHQVRLTGADEDLWQRILPQLEAEARFRPPRVRDLTSLFGVDEAEIRRVLKLCARLGRVDQIARDHFFTRTTTAEMVGLAQDAASQNARGEFTAAAFRDRMDNGRKVAIEILDFFDRHGVTLRRGDPRRMNPHRADLFGSTASNSSTASNGSTQLNGPTGSPETDGKHGRESSLVGRPDFKSGWGSETVPGGFDSHSLPPPTSEG